MATSASYISAVFKGFLLFVRIATTAGRSVPLPSSAVLGAVERAFFGDPILRFGAGFGVLSLSALALPPWSNPKEAKILISYQKDGTLVGIPSRRERLQSVARTKFRCAGLLSASAVNPTTDMVQSGLRPKGDSPAE